jgi:hypothetical protein
MKPGTVMKRLNEFIPAIGHLKYRRTFMINLNSVTISRANFNDPFIRSDIES